MDGKLFCIFSIFFIHFAAVKICSTKNFFFSHMTCWSPPWALPNKSFTKSVKTHTYWPFNVFICKSLNFHDNSNKIIICMWHVIVRRTATCRKFQENLYIYSLFRGNCQSITIRHIISSIFFVLAVQTKKPVADLVVIETSIVSKL